MSTVRRRRLAATALAATAVLVLGGCGTGFNAQTNQVYQAGIGANHRGEMDVLNTLFVANDDKSATLSAAIVNHGDSEQRLSTVTVTTLDDKPLKVRSLKILVPLPADELTTIGGASDAGGFQIIEGATAGDYVRVTLTFSGPTPAKSAAPVTIEAPVVTRTADYDKVASEPVPTAKPADGESTEGSADSSE